MRLRWAVLASAAAVASGVGLTPALAQNPFDPAQYGITWQSGLRYWYSTGKHKFDLLDVPGTAQVSRLTWDDLTGHAAETFFRADHWSGIFLKGTFGAGSLTDGKLKDEDFPPFVVPYSSTDSSQRDGNTRYGNIDLGYTFLKNPAYRLGGFVGYHWWREKVHAFGCRQTATSGICVPEIPNGVLAISEDFNWRSWRFGLVGDLKLSDRLSLTAEAAYLVSDLKASDTHHLRADLPRPTPIDGDGRGYQLEAVLSYALTEAFSLGIGGRYWKIEPDGQGRTHFEVSAVPPGLTQRSKLESERYGVFVQGSYKMGAAPQSGSTKDGPVGPAPYKWTGAYAGIHLGQATDDENVRYRGDDATARAAIAAGFVPTRQEVNSRGILGGVQVGYNWQMGTGLVGVEADISAASIAGANSTTPVFFANTTAERNVDWLGTLRTRAGFLVAPSLLLYATGGLAFGRTELTHSVTDLIALCGLICAKVQSSGTSAGWTLGAGYEYAFASNMTWRTEYLFVDLGSRSALIMSPATTGAYRATTDFDMHIVRTAINFKF
jgi:opacity protein-like surface antigen/outer membrane protease